MNSMNKEKNDYEGDANERIFEKKDVRETVNGTEILLTWDDFRGYVVSIPGTSLKGHEMDLDENEITISENPTSAIKVLEKARELALNQKFTNPFDIERGVGEFARSLDHATPESHAEVTRKKIHKFTSHPDHSNRKNDEAVG